jgi:hypothetical protein
MDGIVRKFQDAMILPESATREIFIHYAKILAILSTSGKNGCPVIMIANRKIFYTTERGLAGGLGGGFFRRPCADLAV